MPNERVRGILREANADRTQRQAESNRYEFMTAKFRDPRCRVANDEEVVGETVN